MIDKLIEHLHEELEDSKKYLHCARKSEGYAKTVYITLAGEELQHSDMLMELGNKMNFDKESRDGIIWEFEKGIIKHKQDKIKTELSYLK